MVRPYDFGALAAAPVANTTRPALPDDDAVGMLSIQ